MYLVVSDYDQSKGGAGRVAQLEYGLIANYNAKWFFIHTEQTSNKLIFLVQIIIQNVLLIYTAVKHRRILKKIFVHTWSLFPAIIFLNYIFKKRMIFIAHDYKLICPSKAMYNFNTMRVCSLRGGSRECLQIDCGYGVVKKCASALEVKLLGPVDVIRCLSEKSAETFRSSGTLHNLYVKRNVDTYANTLIDDRINLCKPYVLFAGRYTYDKGADIYFDLASKYQNLFAHNQSNEDDIVKFYSCGAGPIEPPVHVVDLGWVSQDDVLSVIANAKLVVYPARQIDCDPLIFQACYKTGTPMLVFSHNAIADDVKWVFGEEFVMSEDPMSAFMNALISHQNADREINYPRTLNEVYSFV